MRTVIKTSKPSSPSTAPASREPHRCSALTAQNVGQISQILKRWAKRAAHKSRTPRINTANAQALATCPRCQRTFRAQISLVGQFNNNPITSTSATPASNFSTMTTQTTDNKLHRCPAATAATTDTILPTPSPTPSSLHPPAEKADSKSQESQINTTNARALPTCPRCQRTFCARIDQVGHLKMQCNNNPTTQSPVSTNIPSATPALNAMMMTTPTASDYYIDAPPLTTTNTTCHSPTTSVATANYLPPATSNTTTAPSTSDGESVLTCPHYDHTSAWPVTCESSAQRQAN
ncbi:unnamed protein product [Schistocephalus solidus]|uniref:C2H2-type domain-containing protein n=1 Tax=Schistocephalus solidus TaxID=70667 RepID=A0A183SLP8_SCHSO|nr:unnamed protein product [Schistocephalus solidus]